MNPRIQLLAEQADYYAYEQYDVKKVPYSVLFNQKFAELIVRECAKILDTEMYRLDALPGREVSAQAMETASILVKKHFGVEE